MASLLLLGAAPSAVTVYDVAKAIHPPSCPPNMAADSCPTAEAEQMRERISRMLAQGDNEQQILQAFVHDYGPGILMVPAQRGFGLLAWWVPAVAVAAGMAVLAALLRRWVLRGRRSVPPASTRGRSPGSARGPDFGSPSADAAPPPAVAAAPPGRQARAPEPPDPEEDWRDYL